LGIAPSPRASGKSLRVLVGPVHDRIHSPIPDPIAVEVDPDLPASSSVKELVDLESADPLAYKPGHHP